MKILILFLICLHFLLAPSQSSSSPMSLTTGALIEAYKTISNLNSKDFKNVNYAIDLLTNLTSKLVNSSNKTCNE